VIEVPRNGPVVRQDQLQAVLDASDLVDPGYHNVQVKLVAPDVAIKSLSPASVHLVPRPARRSARSRFSIVYSGESSGRGRRVDARRIPR